MSATLFWGVGFTVLSWLAFEIAEWGRLRAMLALGSALVEQLGVVAVANPLLDCQLSVVQRFDVLCDRSQIGI